MDLSGKVALITGGAQRAGRYISLALARAGAHIVLNHYNTEKDAQITKADIEKLGRSCITIDTDINNITSSRAMIDEIEATFGRLDILVHNASNLNRCPFMEVTEEIWESSFGVNLKAPFFLSQAAVRLMMKNNAGRIIALVGNSYFENWPEFIPHSIAKTGLAKLMQSLAIALSPTIQCNAICPASFLDAEESKSIRQTRGDDHKQEAIISKGISLHKGTPEEVAELVVYLASCSSYLNGTIIPIDGGKYAL
jgi:NAD(P)-dependent dehydrogenase (short-subunit alcohol dehydrogenase family)